MSNGQQVPPPPPQQQQLAPPPAITVRAQEGGVILGITYPHMQTLIIIPEDTIPGLIEALKKHSALIPKVILG